MLSTLDMIRLTVSSSSISHECSTDCSRPLPIAPSAEPSSNRCSPSSDQPCAAATSRSSSTVSDRVMYRQRSPRCSPSSRNCSDKVVLPEPGGPSSRYSRACGRPPPRMLSSPSIPVAIRMCACIAMTNERRRLAIPLCRHCVIQRTCSNAFRKISRRLAPSGSRAAMTSGHDDWTYANGLHDAARTPLEAAQHGPALL